ncbi:DUF2779 domain-containing protein [Lacibacter sp.]|uniref:DUF2779 domain-containing protein n=1 Tax=Lacibacter sp. TaxID=1915409 RepID=UPI002B4B2EC9|nr:DUF2779 domain-containing protein [Lacibacter sp.]HLP37054.1 DUF2779 domain-containing protein [Lacibacter sp.]
MKSPKPERHLLSKSTFMYGCQCPKRLWLHKFKPEVRDEEDEAQIAIFQSGTDVGMLARQLFPGGIDASPETAYLYQQSVADTAKYISKGHTIIYEAAFQYNGVLAAMDILVQQNGKWYAFEVKGTLDVKEQHELDAALQYYVLSNAGLELEDISILHLNRDYVRSGDLDIQQLFTATSVLENVVALQPLIQQKEAELKDVLKLKSEPAIEPGNHCSKPYPCDFYGYCSKDLVEEEAADEEYHFNTGAIGAFLETIQYPILFLDFETWMAAVPEQDGHWPYRQVPFQYSLHIKHSEETEVEHMHYLAEGPHSPHLQFALHLLSSVPQRGTVVVYNKTFENMILNQLKEEFEELAPAIEHIQERIVDLMAPFRKHYRTPLMQGSYSIKYVLPALVPELSYSELAIGNGGTASAAFYNLKHATDAAAIETTRNALLEYCKLDTWAMVKLLERLQVDLNKASANFGDPFAS